MLISIKRAVTTAQEFVADMFPEARDIRLEEVAYLENYDEWEVTLSFPSGEEKTFANALAGQPRLFKTVRINANNGEPLSLKVFKE
jgi:hypothetical protein